MKTAHETQVEASGAGYATAKQHNLHLWCLHWYFLHPLLISLQETPLKVLQL